MDHFGVFMDYSNSIDVLQLYPIKFVSTYFYNYYNEHSVKSNIIDLMQSANAQTDDYNRFITELCGTSFHNIIPLVVRASNLSLLQWYVKNNTDLTLNSEMLEVGFEVGSLDILKWTYDVGIPYNWKNFHTAIKHGHIDVLQWMHQDQIVMKSFKQYKYKFFDWSYYAVDTECCTVAVKYKQLNILNWLINEKYPLSQNTLTAAVNNGDITLLEWLWNYDVKPKTDNEWNHLLNLAVVRNNRNIVMWLSNKNPQIRFTTDTIYEAVSEESWDILNYITENHLLIDTEGLCVTAAIGGSIDVMRWCIANGCELDGIAFIKAVEHGHVELFKWMIQEHPNIDIDMEQIIRILVHILNIKYSKSHIEILEIIHQLYLVKNHIDNTHEINNFDIWFKYISDSYHKLSLPDCI